MRSDRAGASLHNLFFALRPDPATADRASRLTEELRRRHELTGPSVPPERLHISLNPLGRYRELPQRVIARACEAAATVTVRPFVVALNRVVSFQNGSGRRPLVLMGEDGVIGIHALHVAIHAALADAGLARRPASSFTPHLTLLRDSRAAPDEFIDPVSWQVAEFVLIHSPYGESRHEVLGRWSP